MSAFPDEPEVRFSGPRRSVPPGLLLVALVALAVVIGVAAWLLLRGDGDSEIGKPKQATSADLRALVESVGHPVYWAGPRGADRYELTQREDGGVQIRYLSAGSEIGEPRPKSLTVATYPLTNAFEALSAVAKRPGGVTERIEDGGIAVSKEATHTYIAYPGSDLQIEVYDPSPAMAFNIALSGDIRPID